MNVVPFRAPASPRPALKLFRGMASSDDEDAIARDESNRQAAAKLYADTRGLQRGWDDPPESADDAAYREHAIGEAYKQFAMNYHPDDPWANDRR